MAPISETSQVYWYRIGYPTTYINSFYKLEQNIIIRVATQEDKIYATTITDEMESSAKARGTGIAKRSPEYIAKKIDEGKAVIAITNDGTWVGFCYIETWEGEYVANSGLIVSPSFRKSGVAKAIKERIFQLSREMYPEAKIFGLTTGLAVMKINSDLGYEPVTYSELTQDEKFWAGCKSCVNYDILMSKERKNCLCTAMLYDPKDHYKPEETKEHFEEKSKVYERLLKIKQSKFLRRFKNPDKVAGERTSNRKFKMTLLNLFHF
ncbi:MAG TPA: GNAT family N-acetyltransferase [Flavisolibacter sp.]|nr:GNAT family N-acetyltransferase [Flavisolibacter sp.]